MGARTADFLALAAAVRRGDRGQPSAAEQSVEAAQHRVRRGLHLGDFGQSRFVIAGGKEATLPNHMIGLGQADHFSGEIACRDAGKLLPDGGIEPIGTAGDFIDRGSVFFRPCPRCTRCSVPTTPP